MHYVPETSKNNYFYYVVLLTYYIWIVTYAEQFSESMRDRFTTPGGFDNMTEPYFFGYYLIVFWTLSIPYLILTYFKIPQFLYKYKLQDVNSADGPGLFHVVKIVLFNMFAGTLPAISGYLYIIQDTGFFTHKPNFLYSLAHIMVWGVAADIAFFSAHYALHYKSLYGRIHKMHHELKAPICIGTHYSTYTDFMIASLPEILVGPLLTYGTTDVNTFFLWTFLGVFQALHSHSGFNFPYMPYTINHEFHHYNFFGNYGNLRLMDWMFGTDKEFKEFEKSQKLKI